MCFICHFLLIETPKQEAEVMGSMIHAKEVNVMVLPVFSLFNALRIVLILLCKESPSARAAPLWEMCVSTDDRLYITFTILW